MTVSNKGDSQGKIKRNNCRMCFPCWLRWITSPPSLRNMNSGCCMNVEQSERSAPPKCFTAHYSSKHGFINKSLTHKQEATRTSNSLGKKKSKPKPFLWIFLPVFWLSGCQNLNVTDVFLNLLSLTTCSTQKPLKGAHVKRSSHLWHIRTRNIRGSFHIKAFPGGADTRNAGRYTRGKTRLTRISKIITNL